MADDADRATAYEEAFTRAALAAQLAHARRRIAPQMIHGVAHCPDCGEPLPAHRIDAGICVECLSIRERRHGL